MVTAYYISGIIAQMSMRRSKNELMLSVACSITCQLFLYMTGPCGVKVKL